MYFDKHLREHYEITSIEITFTGGILFPDNIIVFCIRYRLIPNWTPVYKFSINLLTHIKINALNLFRNTELYFVLLTLFVQKIYFRVIL